MSWKHIDELLYTFERYNKEGVQRRPKALVADEGQKGRNAATQAAHDSGSSLTYRNHP